MSNKYFNYFVGVSLIVILIFMILILFSIPFSHFLFFTSSQYDKTCLKEKAISFCEKENSTFTDAFAPVKMFEHFQEAYFFCKSNPKDFRLRKNPFTRKYYFLEEELKECLK